MTRRLISGTIAVALLALGAGGVAVRCRANHSDAPPRGPPRLVVLALSAMNGSSVLVDDASVYFLGADSNIRAVAKAGGETRVVTSVPGATQGAFLGADASGIYFFFAQYGGNPHVRRVAKTGGTPVDVPGPCHLPALLDGDAIVCATGALEVSRVDARSGAVRWTTDFERAGDSPNAVAHIARWGEVAYVSTEAQARGAPSRVISLRLRDGQESEVLDSGYAAPLPIAADATGLYAAEPIDNDGAWAVVRHPGPPFAPRVILAAARPAALALTPVHVVWRARQSHDVVMAPKAGGPAVVLVRGDPREDMRYTDLGDIAADANAVYFVDQWDEVIRVEGLD